jgi:NADPH-dependent 2,4-dienoyl-CoA reductase/sulfur reductase-like enzyme
MKTSHCRVAIVGAGPSGLALAAELARSGIDNVVVIERETTAGGIPRHCGHSPYGWREFRRLLGGPEYARRLVARAQQLGVEVRTAVTVTALEPGGGLLLSSAAGMERLQAERVVLCTGNRETPRAPRLVSGSRALGIVTTGALQSMVYLKGYLPFKRPLIVGTELVSFSALLTCRHAGIKPVAMIDARSQVTAWHLASLLPPLLGTPLLMRTSLQEIHGSERVTAVDIDRGDGTPKTLDCDGVVFSGGFVSESSLVRGSHLELDPASGGPRIDQFGRCSDPHYFACGNQLHPVDTAGWCWAEGHATATSLVASLDGDQVGATRSLPVICSSPAIAYCTPQRITLPEPGSESPATAPHQQLQLRFAQDASGRLSLRDGECELSGRNISARRERRVLLPLPPLTRLQQCHSLSLEFEPTQAEQR